MMSIKKDKNAIALTLFTKSDNGCMPEMSTFYSHFGEQRTEWKKCIVTDRQRTEDRQCEQTINTNRSGKKLAHGNTPSPWHVVGLPWFQER